MCNGFDCTMLKFSMPMQHAVKMCQRRCVVPKLFPCMPFQGGERAIRQAKRATLVNLLHASMPASYMHKAPTAATTVLADCNGKSNCQGMLSMRAAPSRKCTMRFTPSNCNTKIPSTCADPNTVLMIEDDLMLQGTKVQAHIFTSIIVCITSQPTHAWRLHEALHAPHAPGLPCCSTRVHAKVSCSGSGVILCSSSDGDEGEDSQAAIVQQLSGSWPCAWVTESTSCQ